MRQLFPRIGILSSVAMIAVMVCGQLSVAAQTNGMTGGSATNAVSAQQLNTAFAAIQQLLHSGILNPTQTQRATALLTAVQNAIAGGSLNSTQITQIGQAIAAARKARQSNNGGGMGGSATNAISAQKLNTAFTAIQQLLQSGILNPAQTQRATALLTAVRNAIAGGALNSTQIQQIGQAIAAARNARQSGNNTAVSAARANKLTGSSLLRSNGSIASAIRQSAAASSLRSAKLAARFKTR